MFMQRLLSAALFGAALAFAAPHAPLANPPTVDASARADAVSVLAAWKKLDAREPGVYVSGPTYFSYALHRIDPKKDGSSAKAKARIAAEAEAVSQLAEHVLKSAFKDDSAQDALIRHYAKNMRLHFEGRVVVSECGAETCAAVFATSESEIEAAQRKLDRTSLEREARADFKKRPDAYGAFFAERGFPDAALALQMRRQGKNFFNVIPPAPTTAKLRAYERFLQSRNSKIAALIDQARSSGVDRFELLAMQSALASENVREFERALKASGIPLLSWPTDHPFLESVAQAQGFVKFEAAASAKTPESMAYVRTLFAEGKNLELATLLLEDAAARHPANAEVWEYLAGAYFAAGKKDPARICTRVWLSLAEGVREPIFYLTTHFDANEGKSRTSDLAQLFN